MEASNGRSHAAARRVALSTAVFYTFLTFAWGLLVYFWAASAGRSVLPVLVVSAGCLIAVASLGVAVASVALLSRTAPVPAGLGRLAVWAGALSGVGTAAAVGLLLAMVFLAVTGRGSADLLVYAIFAGCFYVQRPSRRFRQILSC